MLLALLPAACTHLGEAPSNARGGPGPRDHYESQLRTSRKSASAWYQAWAAEGRRALRSGLAIEPSFREIVRFDESDVLAVGYRLDLRRGQRLNVRIEERTFDGRLFAELFEEIGSCCNPIYRLVQSTDERAFSFEARTDGVHVLRIQPELMKGGDLAITLTTVAGLTFPVAGENKSAIRSVFGDPRDGGRRDHEGIDIFAPRGTSVLAVADGIITNVSETNIGGRVVWQRDVVRGVEYYYAHLESQSVRPGQHVRAGEMIGRVGNTGNARTTPPHLHFGVYRPGRAAIDPVPFIYDAPAGPVLPVLVDLGRLGSWTETAQPATLHASPSSTAAVVADVPARTRVRVLSGVGEWHRVQLEDGRRGFLPGQRNLLGQQ